MKKMKKKKKKKRKRTKIALSVMSNNETSEFLQIYAF